MNFTFEASDKSLYTFECPNNIYGIMAKMKEFQARKLLPGRCWRTAEPEKVMLVDVNLKTRIQ